MRSNDRTFTDQARRTQITLCAIDVIAEIGYAQASIRKIAQRVGVAMSVVLYHFASKDELVLAIVNHAFREAIDMIVPRLERETTAAGKLRAYILANADFLDTHRNQFAAVMDIGLTYRTAEGGRMDTMKIDPELMAGVARMDVAAILRQGQESGEFAEFDVDRTAMAIRGAVLNAPVLEVFGNPEFDLHGYAEAMVALFDRATRRG